MTRLSSASILLAVTLVTASCSSAVSEESSPSTSSAASAVAPTTSKPPADSPTRAAPPLTSTSAPVDERSPLATRVTSLGSALYDASEHTDAGPVPVWISIDGIRVNEAPVIDVGVEDDGDMEIPDTKAVGWYRFNPTPGEPGSAVLAAHISYNGVNGVFRYLSEADIGDRVVVGFDDGTETEFEIIELAQYDKQKLPLERVFAKTGDPVLTLITCGGDFNRSVRSYNDNIVAYAIPIAS